MVFPANGLMEDLKTLRDTLYDERTRQPVSTDKPAPSQPQPPQPPQKQQQQQAVMPSAGVVSQTQMVSMTFPHYTESSFYRPNAKRRVLIFIVHKHERN